MKGANNMLGNFNEEAQNILVKAKIEMSNLKHLGEITC